MEAPRSDRECPVAIGVDVGGTFTDVVLVDGGVVVTAKAPSTHPDVANGILAACRVAADRLGTDLAAVLPRVTRFGVGTTAITNVVATRSGRDVGLITTRGFEETLAMARAQVSTDGGWLVRTPFVPAAAVEGIEERIDARGTVLHALQADDVVAAGHRLVDDQAVEALAVSFLWSCVNPAHEAEAARVLATEFPGIPITSGAELSPAIREYERTSLAVLNAYVAGAFAGIDELAAQLQALGLRAPIVLVHSSGGAVSLDEARRRPVWLAESGPAAGVAAATQVAAASGHRDVITCDLGGTSFDVGHVRAGVPARIQRGELMGMWTALARVDVESVGSGGGSIGWVDARGMLRVGPRSAGSDPGPACYGRGGRDATLTDALVVLGFLDPDRFLGGTMVLDRDAAQRACAALGAHIGLDAVATAWGLRTLALAEMATAVRTRVAQRGLDVATHPLVSYGGCGALFTPEIGMLAGAPAVLVPEFASVLSAYGAATTPIRRERFRTLLHPFPFDAALLADTVTTLTRSLAHDLRADGVDEHDQTIGFEADLRFGGQRSEVTVAIDDHTDPDGLVARFRDEYVRRYGPASVATGGTPELVVVRAVGTGPAPEHVAAPVPGHRHRPRRGARRTAGGADRPQRLDRRRDVRPGRPRARAHHRGSRDRRRERHDDLDSGRVDGSGRADPHPRRGGPAVSAAPTVDAEVLRTHLEAIGHEAGLAIEQTAISTVVSESKDYSVSILDADGRLIVPVGVSPSHFGAAIHAVNATLARYDDIGPGDVFIANDPHDGGGLHPQDVVIQRPVFVDGHRVAWVAIAAHMMDMGGMVPGSSAVEATECFQEALRLPPVRLLRAGHEVTEVWDILRTNIRMAEIIEMDLRSLVIGTFVAHEKLVALIGRDGPAAFAASARAIDEATGTELRRRIGALDDGVYRSVGWAERVDDLYRIPCELTIAGDTMRFDFTGAPPQITNYINSKDYIIRAVTVPILHTLFAADLPLTQSVYDAFDLHCPVGSIVNAQSPAPIGAAHLDVGQVAAGVAFECAGFALAATDDPAMRRYLGAVGYGPRGTCRWSYADDAGRRRTFTLVEGSFAGSPAAHDRDGLDLSKSMHRGGSRLEFADVEVLESTFPILVLERRTRRDAFGAGEFRSGLGCHEALTASGTDLVGYMSGSQSWWPTPGFAGGLPGAPTAFLLTRADGSVESVGMQAVAVALHPGDRLDTLCATGGGFGDPLARRPDHVADDVRDGAMTEANARAVHGVALTGTGARDVHVDVDATAALRASRLQDRVARSDPPRVAAPEHPDLTDVDDELPLFPGVVQRGAWAFSTFSGACLAAAPDHWSDGCRVLELALGGRDGRVVVRAYLDPVTGHALHVEVVPPGTPRTFSGGPNRWRDAGPA